MNRKIDAIDAIDATFLLLRKDLVKCPKCPKRKAGGALNCALVNG